MLKFNRPTVTGHERAYIDEVIARHKFAGDGGFCQKGGRWFETEHGARKAMLTPSCSHSLEMAAILAGVGPGDEAIMPSFTFVSTANAIALRGARIAFADVRPDTMNLDERKLEQAITPRTKAIVLVHYAGVGCEMDAIMAIAERYGLVVIEDAAQAIKATYKGRYLGTIGAFGCISFHETKNVQCGEGGALLLNHERFIERAEIVREKGTDRCRFFRGQVDKYTWQDIGSSYLLGELSAAFVVAQLERVDMINADRMKRWSLYGERLAGLRDRGRIDLPHIPEQREHNAHIFYIKVKDLEERSRLIEHLAANEVQSVFHYVPLHSTVQGGKLGYFVGEDEFTTRESERLLRLPLYYGLEPDQVHRVADLIYAFYDEKP